MKNEKPYIDIESNLCVERERLRERMTSLTDEYILKLTKAMEWFNQFSEGYISDSYAQKGLGNINGCIGAVVDYNGCKHVIQGVFANPFICQVLFVLLPAPTDALARGDNQPINLEF